MVNKLLSRLKWGRKPAPQPATLSPAAMLLSEMAYWTAVKEDAVVHLKAAVASYKTASK